MIVVHSTVRPHHTHTCPHSNTHTRTQTKQKHYNPATYTQGIDNNNITQPDTSHPHNTTTHTLYTATHTYELRSKTNTSRHKHISHIRVPFLPQHTPFHSPIHIHTLSTTPHAGQHTHISCHNTRTQITTLHTHTPPCGNTHSSHSLQIGQ